MATDEQEGNVYQTNLCFCGLSSALKTPVDAWCDRGIWYTIFWPQYFVNDVAS